MNNIMLQVTSIDMGWVWTLISGTIIGIFGWSVSRNISSQDNKIKDVEDMIKKISDDMERLKEKSRDTAEITNGKISDMKEVVLKEMGAILVRIAEIKRNDAK